MAPPIGSIVVGPCPQCDEYVAVFCGETLALDKELILGGAVDEKHEHIMAVLTQFLSERVHHLIEKVAEENGETEPELSPAEPLASLDEDSLASATIKDAEFEHFRKVELNLLDNSEYFQAVFGK